MKTLALIALALLAVMYELAPTEASCSHYKRPRYDYKYELDGYRDYDFEDNYRYAPRYDPRYGYDPRYRSSAYRNLFGVPPGFDFGYNEYPFRYPHGCRCDNYHRGPSYPRPHEVEEFIEYAPGRDVDKDIGGAAASPDELADDEDLT
ncbi:hypothetical protein LSTR_LSTR003075 [Laodelphax striatellus]|uniref:Uncharacterized protein n=1 Tax=Laodelphax striatellus TaxID=195883 RepID=A0A482WVV0_LAOST|nr:hypothetical protein LSTR_LSTR003075 [Laodelphax striatellus]